MRAVLLAGASLFAVTAFASAALADEGMWTFDNFPAAAVKAKYGVTIDQAWLDHVRGAAARLSVGCSSSIVSGEGLVLTNDHCVRDCAQQQSTAGRDYAKEGFIAANRQDERECAGMVAEVLDTITDVTSRVKAAAAGQAGEAFVKARDAAVADIEKSGCAGREARFHCQVVNLYEGGQYKLYAYRKYSDVRLVFAPETGTAFFGGDPDNFNFPRYDLDCGFLRLYENGAPAATPDHLTWNARAPAAGDPVFVAGNPGSTERLLTADQLETLRDNSFPFVLAQFAELRGRLIRFGEESPEHARIASDDLFGIENSYKAIHGQEQTLSDPAFIEAKRRDDAALRAKVLADPKLAAEIRDPWADIARIQADAAELSMAYRFEERGPFTSQLYGYAVTLVRAAQERSKPNGERLREYADARLPSLEKETLDPVPVYPDLEQLSLEFWLSKLREGMTMDSDATKTFLGKGSPETISARLSRSRLADAAYRKQLWDGGLAAIQASDDPLIQYLLRVDPVARAARKAYETRVTGPTAIASERIAKARFAVYGASVYPDATFTLRLTYGTVEGWTWRGVTVAPFTHFKGLYERATGEDPFALTPRWIAAQAKVDPSTVFDISVSTDVTGGNSGSPLIDARGEVIGAVFDGNIHSLGGAFAYDGALNRTVAVSTAAITEALDKVYGDETLVRELRAP
ncbi:MAG TPA: S46 family peptidase [Caulobacteraceae bacterium]